jgi:hypothetical protein
VTSSGTYNFALGNSDCIVEALNLCQIRPAEITRTHMIEAVRSLNLELQVWGTRGVNLWQVQEGIVLPLTAPTGQVGVPTYTLPNNLLQILNVRYNMPQQNVAGGTIDRIMLPIGRDDYAAYPNKVQAGTPTVYWFQRLIPTPQITIWQPDQTGPPNTLTYDALRQSQDAAAGMGQTPDAPNRFLDALSQKLAHRLFRKFWTDVVKAGKMTEQAAVALMTSLKEDAEEAWQLASLDDQEEAPLIVQPDLSGYYSPR